MSATAQALSNSQSEAQRTSKVYLKTKNGDIVGPNYTVPKGDFARFLGMTPPTEGEKQGSAQGWRAIEVALQKEFNKLGESSVKDGNTFRNMIGGPARFDNQPGRTKDSIASGIDAMKESVEMGHAMGIRYLEMQYKFLMASTNYGAISNLMKARSESVKKAINEIR